MNKEKYYIRTYGCQMNLYEADIISAIMDKAGFVQVSNEREADIVYLVTCSVRSHAENRILGRLSSLKQLKKLKPDLIIGILGCMAQNYKGKLSNGHGVDLVVGPDEYRRLPELVDKFTQVHKPQIQTEFNTENYEGILPKVVNKTTGFVSIMRGCNNYCSYCIVPYVRGRERSKPKGQVIQEVNNLINNGVKDITLVGQNVLAWNDDGLKFLDLLKIVDGISRFDRLRFITSHPKDITIKHFDVLLTLKKFCPNIHLPLQSGSNRILNLMNRGYTKEEYIQKVKKGREIIPDISFTTDVMVGFPTETDDDFKETLDIIEQLTFDFSYMFKYSERPNTKACEIKPQVNEKKSQQRLTKLIEMQNQITNEKSKELLDKTLEVLVESKNGKQSYARTKTNKVVILEEPVETGKTYLCKVIRVVGWTPIGEIVNN